MPNPRAQRPLSLQAVTEDIRSLAQPAEALLDMLAGAAKGSVTATAGIGGDLESLARGLAAAYRAPSGQRMDAFAGGMEQPTVLPTTRDISAKLPAVVPTTAPLSRQHTAEYGQGMGEFIPTPGSGRVYQGALNAVKSIPAAIQHGAQEFAKASAMGVPHVVKPQRGQFHADTITSVGRAANNLAPATPKMASARLNNLRAALASAEDSLPNSLTVKNLREEVAEGERINALNDWVLNNVQNYMKRDMGSPNDPIRKLYDARAKQGEKLEADFHKKMKALETKVNEIEAGPQTDDSRRALVYLKNAMEDEVVKLQTEKEFLGITHRYGGKPFDLPESDEYQELVRRRLDAGFPGMGMAESDLGRAWEAAADQAIQITPAGNINQSRQVFDELTALEKQINDRRSKISNDFYEKFIVPSLDDQKKANALNRMDPFLKEELLGEKGQLEALMNQHTEILKENPNVSLNFDVAQRNPWVSKLEPQEPVYGVYPNYVDLEHIIDVLGADLKAGRIKPEQLNKVSMDQAVARTIEHETDKARKLAEEANNLQKLFPVHKEYPEGYKWIELTKPTGLKLPEGYSIRPDPITNRKTGAVDTNSYRLVAPDGKLVGWGQTEEEAISSGLGEKFLADALADEGKRMGHCVGQYCEDVAKGETRIFSLRDRRGTPHATIEVKPMSPESAFYELPERDRAGIRLIAQRMADEQGIGYYEALDQYIRDRIPGGGNRIVQIKGKGNKEVAEKYWPYAQDFVRSGDYEHVNDLVNAGLNWKLSNLFDPEQVEKLKAAGYETPRFLNDQERNNLIERLYEIETGKNIETGTPLNTKPDPLENLFDDIDDINPPQGMKRGGRVHVSNNRDAMQMEVDERKFQVGGIISNLASAGAKKVAKGVATKAAEKTAEKTAEKQAIKASEALAPHIGKNLGVTEVDRSLTDPDIGVFGGIHFPRLQHESLPHADVGATWGTMTESAAGRILGAQKKHPKDSVLWTTRIGGPESHRGNDIVFGRLIEDFAKNLSTGKVSKEQIEKINKYLSNATYEKGGPKIFPDGFDITQRSSLDAANTFDRRQLVAKVLAGDGVGGQKGKTVDYERIMREMTEPSLVDAKTGMVGQRLFQLSGDMVTDPTLNPAFHKILLGKDLDVEYQLSPGELMMPQLYKRFQETKGRLPSEYDFRRGHYPVEPITDQMVNRLAIEGFKEGGKASTNALIKVKKGKRRATT